MKVVLVVNASDNIPRKNIGFYTLRFISGNAMLCVKVVLVTYASDVISWLMGECVQSDARFTAQTERLLLEIESDIRFKAKIGVLL